MTSSSIHQQNNNLKTMKIYNYFLSILLYLITLSCQQVPEDDGWLSEEEMKFAEKVVKDAGYEAAVGESVFLIDCRKDNKKSASIA